MNTNGNKFNLHHRSGDKADQFSPAGSSRETGVTDPETEILIITPSCRSATCRKTQKHECNMKKVLTWLCWGHITFRRLEWKKTTLSRWPRVSGRFHIAGDKFQHIIDVEPLVTADRKSRPSQNDAGLESADRQKAANKQVLLRVSQFPWRLFLTDMGSDPNISQRSLRFDMKGVFIKGPLSLQSSPIRPFNPTEKREKEPGAVSDCRHVWSWWLINSSCTSEVRPPRLPSRLF